MNILISANAPWASTGYGVQGRSLARRLRDAGHHVTYFCNYGLRGGAIVWEGMQMLPTAQDNGYTDPILNAHLRTAQADLLITLQDLWPWRNLPFPDLPERTKWAAWIPIDHEPLSQANLEVLTRVSYPIAMSEFGQRVMAERGVKSTFIPHGVEKEFHWTAAGRREMRRYWQVPDEAMVFGTVGINYGFPDRKGVQFLMQAFAELPEDCYLYIHGSEIPLSGHGMNYREVADFYGITERVIWPDPYNYAMGFGQTGMNAAYSAMDCYVQPTMGEGFGLPVIEAQACGVPVIATNCTSMPELVCEGASELIAGRSVLVPDIAHRTEIDVLSLQAAMEEIREIYLTDRTGHSAMRARCGLHANGWDWDRVWEEAWVPFLATIEEEQRRSPRTKQHRGQGLVFEHEGMMRKQDSSLASPAVDKELALLLELQDVDGVIPVVEHGVNEDGTTWFDMPKFTPLADIDPADLTEENIQHILDDLSRALNELHDRERSHRDVCPENVVIDRDWMKPYLIDFEWANPCEGRPCVDFEPWEVPTEQVPVMQMGLEQRGYHTIVAYLRGLDLDDKTHGWKGVPYQQIDGVGERDCQLRWDLMQPDVVGKTVLDLGSNLGWFLRKSIAEGAQYTIGVESDAAVAAAANELSNNNGDATVVRDLDGDLALSPFDGDFDVIFALSILQHLKNPDRVWDWMLDHGQEIYLELPERFITEHMAETLRHAKMLGESERGRPIWHLVVAEVRSVAAT